MLSETQVVSGAKNLENGQRLSNEGHVKRIFKNYVRQNEVLKSQTNEVKYDKRCFIPFVDERDQLGRLISNVSHKPYSSNLLQDLTDYQKFPRDYVKKKLIFRPRKGQDKIEFSDDIPSRWKDTQSPLKDQQFYNRKRS